MSSFVIYLLRLEQGKYYVGRTDNMENRWKAHTSGRGSLWTKKYHPIEILRTYTSKNPFEEDKYTKECMSIYGIDNVRGGSYVRDVLDLDAQRLIQKEIWAAKDCCVRCGRNSHFVKECCFTTDIFGNSLINTNTSPTNTKKSEEESIVYMCGYCEHEFDIETDCDKHMETCDKNTSRELTINKEVKDIKDINDIKDVKDISQFNRHFFGYHLITVPNMIGFSLNIVLAFFLLYNKPVFHLFGF